MMSFAPAVISILMMAVPAAPGTVQDDVDVLHLLAHHAQGVDEGSGDDDGRAMLVVVEDGDVQLTLQGLLDLKALGAS